MGFYFKFFPWLVMNVAMEHFVLSYQIWKLQIELKYSILCAFT